MSDMFLAFNEVRRAKIRFGLLVGVTALLMFLILILQTFRIALVTVFVGAIENQSAPVLVYDVDARRSLTDSTITPEFERLVRNADGVAEVGRVGQSIVPASVGERTTVMSLIGFDEASVGGPTQIVEGRTATASNEAVASSTEFGLGDRISIPPGGLELDVVGVTQGSDLFAAGVFTTYDTYLEAVASANPDAVEPVPNALGVRPADGVDPDTTVDHINALDDDIDALTRADAADRNPSVVTVTSLFNSLLPLFGAVVPFVVGTFFAVIIAQKAETLTLLRAIGARSATLVWSLIVQVVAVLGIGLLVGVGLYGVATSFDIAGIDLPFLPEAVAFWIGVLMTLGVASSLLSARRVLGIDPIRATTGSGVGK